MADTIFNSFLEALGDGTHDMDNDTFKIMLLTDAYTIDATDAVVADLSGEVVGAGYTATGVDLTGVTWTQTAGTLTFDADNPEWTAATFTARYAVIYNDTAAGDPLVCLIDFLANKTVTAGTFTIAFNLSGILTMAQA